jgi:hypothetical protein
MLRQATGIPLYLIAMAGLVFAALKRPTSSLLLAGFLPYFVLLTLTSWVVVRYTLPLLPILAIAAALFVVRMYQALPGWRAGIIAIVVAGMGWTLMSDIAYTRMESRENVRDVVSRWIKDNIDSTECILTVRTYLEDVFFNPVIPSGFCNVIFSLRGKNSPQELFDDRRFRYLVLHADLYRSMERLGVAHPYPSHSQFYETLSTSGYRIINTFQSLPTLLSIDFSSSFSSNDYLIVNPEIRIYRRE